MIAQDVKELFPELVVEKDHFTNDEIDSKGKKRFFVNYQGFVPVLINAINEQKVIIDELQEKVDEIDELKEELENLKQLIINNN